jgi:serine/threonine protein kinase
MASITSTPATWSTVTSRGCVVVRMPHLVIALTLGQPNILVDDSGCPRITDFGLAMVTQNQDSIRSAQGEHAHTARWTAPEILNDQGTYSKEADVFSFAMVVVEVRRGYTLWLGSSPTTFFPNTGFHWRGPIPQSPPSCGSIGHIGWEATDTANSSRSYEQVVDIDGTLLE